jgi:hypothetical protein
MIRLPGHCRPVRPLPDHEQPRTRFGYFFGPCSRSIRQAKWYDDETKTKGGDVETDPLSAIVVKDGDPITSLEAACSEPSTPTRCLL